VNNHGVGKLHHCLNMWFCDRQLEDSALKMSLELDWPCCDTLLQPIAGGRTRAFADAARESTSGPP